VVEISFHRYKNARQVVLQDIAGKARKYGVMSSMLERIGAGYGDLQSDLKLASVSAWQQYTLAFTSVSDSGGKYYGIRHSDKTGTEIVMGARTKFFRQYFKFIRRGAVRIEAKSNKGVLDPVAFINKNGKYVVVVKAASARNFSVQGLPDGEYGIKFTTNDQYDVDAHDATVKRNELLHASIPGKGVITIYGK